MIWVTRHNKKAFAVVDTELFQTILETIEILNDPDAFQMFRQKVLMTSEWVEFAITKMSKMSWVESEHRDGPPSLHPMRRFTAKDGLAQLPKKVRRGLLDKIEELLSL